MPDARYRHNPQTHIYHDTDNLDERCNTDDIANPVDKPGIVDGYDGCRWCVPGRELVDLDGRVSFAVTNSTNVREIAYTPGADEGSGDLLVMFTSGALYKYERVPEDVFHRLRNAKSVGSTFDRLVKRGSFTFTRIIDDGRETAVLPPSGDEAERESEEGHDTADSTATATGGAPGGSGESVAQPAAEGGDESADSEHQPESGAVAQSEQSGAVAGGDGAGTRPAGDAASAPGAQRSGAGSRSPRSGRQRE